MSPSIAPPLGAPQRMGENANFRSYDKPRVLGSVVFTIYASYIVYCNVILNTILYNIVY